VDPFLNWAGGKRWFVRSQSHLLPTSFNTYVEPFLGAGAVFFSLQPKRAVLSDANAELMGAYMGIKHDWRAVLSSLKYRQRAHHADPHYYERVRMSEATDLVQQASRLVYLNRVCFNGLYRVNRSGEFNVPRGSKNRVLLESDDFEAAAKALRGARLYVSDFERIVDNANRGDLVFSDPPYTVKHNLNGFIKYNEQLFSWSDQVRLADALQRAIGRGAMVVSTNANHSSVRDLYRDRGFCIKSVSRVSKISGKAEFRGRFDELVILGNLPSG
jgi:DNA adenine methylase